MQHTRGRERAYLCYLNAKGREAFSLDLDIEKQCWQILVTVPRKRQKFVAKLEKEGWDPRYPSKCFVEWYSPENPRPSGITRWVHAGFFEAAVRGR